MFIKTAMKLAALAVAALTAVTLLDASGLPGLSRVISTHRALIAHVESPLSRRHIAIFGVKNPLDNLKTTCDQITKATNGGDYLLARRLLLQLTIQRRVLTEKYMNEVKKSGDKVLYQKTLSTVSKAEDAEAMIKPGSENALKEALKFQSE